MRAAFVKDILRRLIGEGRLSRYHSLLAVCAGRAEWNLFSEMEFSNVTLTSLDPVVGGGMHPFKSAIADVRKLGFGEREYDWVFVSDGLHHCDSPHAALVEMYRVARLGVIVFESRDSLVMRLAVRAGMVEEYEISAVSGHGGLCAGVNYTSVPNYVYRWHEREFIKTVACADPSGSPCVIFYYGFNPPLIRHRGIRRVLLRAIFVLASLIFRFLPKQGNSFAMIALRPTVLFPWLERTGSGLRFRQGLSSPDM